MKVYRKYAHLNLTIIVKYHYIKRGFTRERVAAKSKIANIFLAKFYEKNIKRYRYYRALRLLDK